jgi:hypothetical protein
MARPLSTLLTVAALLTASVACGELEESPEDVLSPTSTPERLSLPFSWEEYDLRFTIFDVAPATSEEEQGVGPLEGYRQYVIHFQFENLLSQDLEIPEGGAGFDSFKLKTVQGNVYEPRFVGGFPVFGSLRPRSIIASANYVFEIRTDETPAELWAYDDFTPGLTEELQLVYIFVLK